MVRSRGIEHGGHAKSGTLGDDLAGSAGEFTRLLAFGLATSNTFVREAMGFFLKGMMFEATAPEARAM